MKEVSRRNFVKLGVGAGLGLGALSLAGCGGGGETAGSTSEGGSSSELITVGIINNDPNESGYRTANDNDMKNTFNEENGFDASFAYSMKNEEQITSANQFIQNGVKYLLLSAADTAGWDTTLQDAKDAGTQVILFDRVVDASEDLYVAAVVSDMDAEGQTAVDWLESQALDEYNIIHIQGVMGSAAQVGRTGALDKAVEEKGWNLVVQQTADWDAETAQQITQSVIDSGESFNVIYAENDDMARGAVAALDASNITHGVDGDVILVSFDAAKTALGLVQEGKLNACFECNPLAAPFVDEDVIKVMEAGGTPEKEIYMTETWFVAEDILESITVNGEEMPLVQVTDEVLAGRAY